MRARLVGRGGVDDQQLVDERYRLHQLPPRAPHDGPDGGRLVERRQDQADGQALALLEGHQPAAGRRTPGGGSSIRRTSGRPARARCAATATARSAASSVSACSARSSKIGRVGASRVLTTMTVGRACWAMASGRAPKSAALGWQRQRAGSRQGGRTHDHEPGAVRLAQDRRRRRSSPSTSRAGEALAVRVLRGRTRPALARPGHGRLGSMSGGTTCSTSTSAPKAGPSASAKRRASSACGPPRTGTRMRRTSLDAALLDDRDVAGRVAHDLVDGRAEDGLGRSAAGTLAARLRGGPAPAEEDEVGLLFRRPPRRCPRPRGGRCGPWSAARRRPARTPARAAAGDAPGARGWRPRRAAMPSAHLDDAERREHAAVLQERGADAHEVGRRARVGERDEDADGQAAAAAVHAPASSGVRFTPVRPRPARRPRTRA